VAQSPVESSSTIERLLPYAVIFGIVVWAIVAWFGLRPHDAVLDWNGWRQADTQTIALNLLKPGASILRPQINWGGDGPGYVETEFQLYTWTIAFVMRVVGPSEWPGQALSLLAICAAAWLLWLNLKETYDPYAALFGVLAFFGSRSVIFLGTVVQPDALALFCCAAGWLFWMRYLRHPELRSLVLFAVFGGLAMLIKPTEAQIGVASFAMVVLSDRARLKSPSLWLAWALMVLVLVAHLVHANHLYLDYGNTFGVLAGGYSKLPQPSQVLKPDNLSAVVQNALSWGTGYVAGASAVYLLVRGKLRVVHWALLLGLALMAVLAFRYTARAAGNYYFAPGAILGAHLVAAMARDLQTVLPTRSPTVQKFVWCSLAVLLAVQLLPGLRSRHHEARYPRDRSLRVALTGRALGAIARPDDLVIVRSTDRARDPEWGTANNYEDPRVFYVSGTHGWVLDLDESNPAVLARAAQRGAKFYVDPTEAPPEFTAWLAAHATREPTPPGAGGIWRL